MEESPDRLYTGELGQDWAGLGMILFEINWTSFVEDADGKIGTCRTATFPHSRPEMYEHFSNSDESPPLPPKHQP